MPFRISRNSLPVTLAALLCSCGSSSKEGFRVEPVPPAVRKHLGLSDFHQKRVEVGGFSILGSSRVSDFALREAAYLIRRMVGNRDDLLAKLNENKARFVIMARDEYTTDVPEHSDLTPSIYWDQRARGLGATEIRPAVTCGEENLLCLPGDPYPTENILIHEFAHALHEMAIVFIDQDFQDKLEKCFESSLREKIWEGTYASTNVPEYWAEGVQSWFDTNRENDHDHGPINTREELKQSDPRLAALIQEVFGESEWRYRKPLDRAEPSPHFEGYQAEAEKAFAWPARFAKWKKDFDRGLVSLAPEGSPEIKTKPWDEDTVLRSSYSRKRSMLYFHNLSRESIILEWIDFDGRPRQGRTLRHRDHQEINSFVGHVWQIKRYEDGKVSSRFKLPEKPNSQLTLLESP
ncbi:MAG: hypothetical protein VX969_04515 [Verrucomicrobiota bacterium]|nr:hypothetical protein [Verrucomicrobiota bacterium]